MMSDEKLTETANHLAIHEKSCKPQQVRIAVSHSEIVKDIDHMATQFSDNVTVDGGFWRIFGQDPLDQIVADLSERQRYFAGLLPTLQGNVSPCEIILT